MRRALAAILFLAFMTPASARTENYFPLWPEALQSDVARIGRGFKGEFALYVKDLSTGARYSYNSATPMYLASGIKLAVMIAVFKQANAGLLALDDELVYGEEDLRDGAPLLSYLRYGTPVSVRILMESMIHQSDNAATDMLIQHVGLETVDRTLVEEGLNGFGPITTLLAVRRLSYHELDSRTDRFGPKEIFQLGIVQPLEARLKKLAVMLGEPPGTFTVADFDDAFSRYYQTGYNTASMEAIGALLEGLVRGRLVSPEHSRAMMEIMRGTQTGERRVKGGLPPSVPFGHKTGTQYQRIADFGFFTMPNGREIIIAFTVKGGGSKKKSEDLMAKVTSRIYAHLASAGNGAGEDRQLSGEEEKLLAPEGKRGRRRSAPSGERRKASDAKGAAPRARGGAEASGQR